ncbi:Nitric oxide reductase NADH:FprA oxidoreductase, partial [Dysosmobacter welbionis]
FSCLFQLLCLLFLPGSGERPLAPQEHRTEGRDPDGGGAFLSMGGHGLHHHRLRIAETVAAVCGVIGIEHGHIPPVGRHAHPIVRIGVGREVHRAHKVAALLVPAQKHHHVVVVVVRHQPFKARPVEVDLPQSRRLFIKGVDLPEELPELLILWSVQQVPVQLPVGVPLVPLADLRPHKQQLLPRVGQEIGVEASQAPQLVVVVPGHLPH